MKTGIYMVALLSLLLSLAGGCSGSGTNPPLSDAESELGTDTFSDTVADNGSDITERDVIADTESDLVVVDTTITDMAGEDTAVMDISAGDTTVGDTTVGDTTVEDTTVEDTTADDTASDDTSTGDATGFDTAVEDTAEADVFAGPTLEFVIVGDPLSDVTFSDAYVSQTPSSFYIGIQQVDLLTSADDASPVTIFDAGQNSYTEVDMQGSTSLTTVDLFSVLSGTYTHAKILLATARFSVQARVHPPYPLPYVDGPVSVVAGLSDTVINSTPRAQDWVQYSFGVGGVNFVKTGVLPVFPDSATGQVIKEDGQTWLLMELSDHLVINAGFSSSYVATVTMKTKDCFRWEDQSTAFYYNTRFDAESSGDSEPVMSFGPGEYSIVISGAD